MKIKITTLLCCVLMIACENPATITDKAYSKVSGKTMGTTYAITYASEQNHKAAIDSLLIAINQEVSTYEPNSTISKFNKTDKKLIVDNLGNQHFKRNFNKAKDVYTLTKGSFDPTVMPLVNYWGFGYTPRDLTTIDSLTIDTLLNYVGFDKVQLEKLREDWPKTSNGAKKKTIDRFHFTKEMPKIQLDFGALAKGYGVDAVGEFLEAKDINDYLVEIGGEVRCRGKNPKEEVWKLGINTPSSDAALTDFEAVVTLKNKSMATSGNYRNYREIEGEKYAHTINPKTGFPEKNNLLSVSVTAADCMTADAFATAFMVMGLDKALVLAERLDFLEAYFIYGDTQGKMLVKQTSGFNDNFE